MFFRYQVQAQEKFLYQDYRGVVHVHSDLSFDSKGKREKIEKAAVQTGIDFVIITDHIDREVNGQWQTYTDSIIEQSPRGMIGQTLFITGGELWKRNGITLATFPLPKNFIPNPDWRINAIELRKLGAAVFASHVEFASTNQLTATDAETGSPFIDGVELVNLHSLSFQKNIFGLMYLWLRLQSPFGWDLAFITNKIPQLNRWQELQNKTRRIIPMFAGNDSHDNGRLATLSLAKVASYHNTFPLLVTHVWAKELSEKSVVEALKKGRSYFAVEKRGPAKGFRFYATDGFRVLMPGDTVKQDENFLLKLVIPPTEGKTEFFITKDGISWFESNGRYISYADAPLVEPGIYQAQVTKDGKPWIYSNAIKVE